MSLVVLLLFLLPFMDWIVESKYIQMLNLYIIMTLSIIVNLLYTYLLYMKSWKQFDIRD
jgi:hypothetical protein